MSTDTFLCLLHDRLMQSHMIWYDLLTLFCCCFCAIAVMSGHRVFGECEGSRLETFGALELRYVGDHWRYTVSWSWRPKITNLPCGLDRSDWDNTKSHRLELSHDRCLSVCFFIFVLFSFSVVSFVTTSALTWWQVQLEEKFQLICKRSTVQSICGRSNLKL